MRLPSPTRPLTATLVGGLSAATLDITYAFVMAGTRGASPARVLQSVASGVLGKAAYQGGLSAAALGLLLHASIAVVMAAVYVTATWFLPVLNRRPWLWGPVYGIGCYLVMNYVVLALRFGPRPTPELGSLIGSLLIHMLGVGLPIALMARRVIWSPRPLDPVLPAATPSA